jgi:hypothetical protein
VAVFEKRRRREEIALQTVSQRVTGMGADIKAAAKELLLKHSRLPYQPLPPYMVGFGDYLWQPLSVEGARIQSKLRDEYSRFHALVACLLRTQAAATERTLERSHGSVTTVIDQHGRTYITSVEGALRKFETAIDDQLNLLAALYDGAEGEHVYVPDTNALLYNPQMEDWRFDGSPQFALLLMPTILSELDHLKVTGRVESVRDKAQRLVRQMMDYRRRGNLNEGVVLRKGSHRLRTMAVEPDFEQSLPWLDPKNNDDRILAGFIEVMRQHPRCPITLVTGDINLSNKADYARVPCVAPPEPTGGAAN